MSGHQRKDSAIAVQAEKTLPQRPPRFDPNLFPVATDLTPIQEEEEDGVIAAKSPISVPPSVSSLLSPIEEEDEDGVAAVESLIGIPPNISIDTAITIIVASIDDTSSMSLLSGWDAQIVDSMRMASTKDKIFAQEVAGTAKSLSRWCAEIEMWDWNGNFEIPQELRRTVEQGQCLDERTRYDFCGSLPAERILYYEDRLEDIMISLQDLNMNDQKNHILTMCSPSKTDGNEHPDSAVDLASPTENGRPALLVDLIVNLFMQAIAMHGQLKSLIGAWHTRIDVLKLVPSLLDGLEDTNLALHQAWTFLSQNNLMPMQQDDRAGVMYQSQELYNDTRATLEARVSTIVAHVDDMLDILDDSEDTLPKHWINEVDELERGFAAWCNEAETILAASSSSQPRCHYLVPRTSLNKEMLASATAAALEPSAMPRTLTATQDQPLYDSETEASFSHPKLRHSKQPLSACESRQTLKAANTRHELRLLVP